MQVFPVVLRWGFFMPPNAQRVGFLPCTTASIWRLRMPEPVDPTPVVEPVVPPVPGPPAETPADPDGTEHMDTDEGKRALRRQSERAQAAETERDRLKALVDAAESAKLSDIEKAQQAVADATAERDLLKTSVARLTALATYSVSEDYRDLVTGTDEASYLASAKRISELEARANGVKPRPDTVPDSGNRSGEHSPAGSNLESGRDLYISKHKKNS